MHFTSTRLHVKKKNRFAVVRGYRSKRRLLNFLTMAIDDYYYPLFVFQSPTHRKARPQFKEKCPRRPGRRPQSKNINASRVAQFSFSFFLETYDPNMIFQVPIQSIFLREPFLLWPLLVISIWIKVKALLWL